MKERSDSPHSIFTTWEGEVLLISAIKFQKSTSIIIHRSDPHTEVVRRHVEGGAGEESDFRVLQQAGRQLGAGADLAGGELFPEGFEVREQIERPLRFGAVEAKTK